MKTIFALLVLFAFSKCFSQSNNLEISGGLGFSGINSYIQNKVEFDNTVKYHIKKNVLDNKYKKILSHSGFIEIRFPFLTRSVSMTKINLGIHEYNYKEVFYKEDSYFLDYYNQEDTMNTPNWLTQSFSIPYIELSISKEFTLIKSISFDISAFFGIAFNFIEHYSITQTLWDKLYSGREISDYQYNKKQKNDQFDIFNYGIRTSISLFPTKFIYPKIIFTQGLNDISKQNFNLNQHANIWSLQVALNHKFVKNSNKKSIKDK